LLVGALHLRVPAPVLEIVAGVAIGPSGFALVRINAPINVLALVGLAFLLFLAGLEIDLQGLRGRVLRFALVGYVVTLGLGVAAGVTVHAVGWIGQPLLLAVALSATSLGLVIPLLKDAGYTDRPLGQLVIAAATVADFAAVLLLSVLFSQSEGSATSRIIMFGVFIGVIVLVAVGMSRAGRSMRFGSLLDRLQDTTAEIRVRIAVALLIGFVALAVNVGLEAILGAFIAGAVLNFVDHDTMSHPHFRVKLEAIGYGFVIPVFFVASGMKLDLEGLFSSPAAAARIPVFLLALLVVRGVPALMFRSSIGTRRSVAAGLLLATSLPFLVTAADIGVTIGALKPVTGAALITAGLLSVVIFPAAALALLRKQDGPPRREGVTPGDEEGLFPHEQLADR
jgi:Kef-type K+ transport system membrane component KefB